jgi:N-acetylmuramic acid 6-phosphate etherase
MSITSREKADYFLNYEKEFHLGSLPTEQSHPKTKYLSQETQKDTAAGVRLIQSVDQDIPPVMEHVFQEDVFRTLIETIQSTLETGGNIYFTGCGATGRLAILLEAIWRRFWHNLTSDYPLLVAKLPKLEDRVISVMTGGDFALIRSVEGYEDYTSFGSYHLETAGVHQGDMVIAITEGGETSFVIGTAWKGLQAGAKVFFVFNNPADILAKQVKRSREIIEDPRIGKLDLATGPMAVTGSTRMQATTSELLAVGTALELGLRNTLKKYLSEAELKSLNFLSIDANDYVVNFCRLLSDLSHDTAVKAISQMVEFEEGIYRRNGLITYMADEYLLDILTDTIERTPTFRIPPFRKCDDTISPRSWAFIKNPTMSTPAAWIHMLRRPLRGIDWNEETYRSLNAPEHIQRNHPCLSNTEILKFQIGNENDPSRYEAADSAAVLVLVGSELSHLQMNHPFRKDFEKVSEFYKQKIALYLGSEMIGSNDIDQVFHVPCCLAGSPLDLWNRLAIKMVMNTISTVTMARMGRLEGNLMAYVETSNKKLIDRAVRLIAELAHVPYEEACYALFDTFEHFDQYKEINSGLPSSVQITVDRIKKGIYEK